VVVDGNLRRFGEEVRNQTVGAFRQNFLKKKKIKRKI
jgi:hypothetical protein